MLHRRTHILFLCLMLFNDSVGAADLEKELRIKNQIIDYILDGEPVMLQTGDRAFLSIYQQADDGDSKQAVILMHGRGLHPNWAEVIYPLRTGLPQRGWNTLSIQMPVLDNTATFYDYLDIVPESFPRIQAAVDFLRRQGMQQIVLLAHSCSVHMSLAWLAQHPQPDIVGYIGVGMGSTDKGQPLPNPLPLEKTPVPVLDIRGEYDYPSVHGHAAERWKHMQQAGNALSRQRVIKDADHYFTNRGEVLLNAVADWLKTLDQPPR